MALKITSLGEIRPGNAGRGKVMKDSRLEFGDITEEELRICGEFRDEMRSPNFRHEV